MSKYKEQIKRVPHSKGNALEFIHRYLIENDVSKKTVVDVSAGSGYVANLWHQAGAKVQAFDMYPEVFRSENLTCLPIDLNEKLSVESNSADYVLLMETIEHIPNQQFLLQEISRILKPSGILIVTKPNNSSFSGRMANLWVEAERSDMFLSNEASVIGYDDTHIYNGRVFLCNAQRLRTLAGLAGLRFQKVYSNQLSVSSLIWYLILGLFLHFRSFRTYKRLDRKTSNLKEKAILLQQHQLNSNQTVLLHKHLCILFRKEKV
ncbi:class I SAM-dependent methyltransferase [Emticicia sp.]|uniref:class I SAM-dependent methyltransferase n=1 Tax=Emticicia sp. TaxID=1930953 RepID=UPI003751C924